MVASVSTVAYLGLEARSVEVQCNLVPGLPKFMIVGLPDKAVAESRERVRAAMAAIGLAMPPQLNCVTSRNFFCGVTSWNQNRHFMRYTKNLSWSGVFWSLSNNVNKWWQQLWRRQETQQHACGLPRARCHRLLLVPYA